MISAEKRIIKVKTFRDLIAWQRAMDLSVELYHVTHHFPKDEVFGLTAQIRRAAVSVPSNLVEGFGRRSRPDYARFILIAIGSLFEIQTQLEMASRLKYLEGAEFERLHALAREVE
jgi:four helix bundle protein